VPAATATADTQVRKIASRTRGDDMGGIVRLLAPFAERKPPYAPSEFAELLKPFIFLDIFNTEWAAFKPFNANPNSLHPHSGLATLTFVTGGTVQFEDTSGKSGVMEEGTVEWLHAAQGAWHGGAPGDHGCRGFQLWVALPPGEELSEVESIYLPKEQVPRVGPATVLLGSYQGVSSRLPAPSDMTYVGVSLRAGECWRYEPPAAHAIGWMATGSGSVRTPELVEARELVAFEPSNQAIEFEAVSDVEFVVGSAVRHPYPLSIGHYSVHTSPEALRKGEARIAEIKARLTAEGRLAPAP
jgi:redox-sensitive bicupin YhaK (pirin superfamily)